MTKFRIEYDNQPDEVVDRVSVALAKHGLMIEYGDGDDGYQEYIITKLDELK